MSVCNCVLLIFHCRNISSSSCLLNPDVFNYDNQAFYENVEYGAKNHQGNVRDRARNTKFVHRQAFQKLTRVRVVDNSTMALQTYRRPPRVIQVYHKTGLGQVGDMVLLAICGTMQKALIVGQKQPMGPLKARTDSNNVILLNEDGAPEGTRINVPIPSFLRGLKKTNRPVQISKIIAITGRFV